MKSILFILMLTVTASLYGQKQKKSDSSSMNWIQSFIPSDSIILRKDIYDTVPCLIVFVDTTGWSKNQSVRFVTSGNYDTPHHSYKSGYYPGSLWTIGYQIRKQMTTQVNSNYYFDYMDNKPYMATTGEYLTDSKQPFPKSAFIIITQTLKQ